ncbi:MAG: regulator [Gammaproteobacteria bacterium]
MSTHTFDDSNIDWQRLGDFEHLHYSILDVDSENNIADVLFKFAANEKILLHRHLGHNNTLVIQGEHRLYEPDGTLKEVRPVGSMTSSPPSKDPHREGGGDQDVVIAFNMRGKVGVLYEVLDDDLNVVGTITFQDLEDLHNAA